MLGFTYAQFGSIYLHAGDLQKAEDYASRSLPLLKGVVYQGMDEYAIALNTLAASLNKQFRTSEAEVAYHELLDRQLERYGPDHFITGRTWNNYSLILIAQGNYQAAEKALLESLRIARRDADANQGTIAMGYYHLGELHHLAGAPHRAIQERMALG